MSAYPLDEPHLAALREVCVAHEAHGRIALLAALSLASPAHQIAADAISTPSASAQLVRDLLGACGVDARVRYDAQSPPEEPWSDCVVVSSRPVGGIYWGHFFARHEDTYSLTWSPVDGNGLPALILALLDALTKTEGRTEAALKSLREAGR